MTFDKKKQFGIVVLLVLLILLPFAISAVLKPTRTVPKAAPVTPPEDQAPATAVVELSTDTNTVAVDGNITVNVILHTNDNQVSATDLTVSFNPSLLEAQRVTAGGFLPQEIDTPVIDNNQGKVRLVYGAAPETPVVGSGSVATIQFLAKAEGTANVSVNGEVAALNRRTSALADTLPATFEIRPQAPPPITIRFRLTLPNIQSSQTGELQNTLFVFKQGGQRIDKYAILQPSADGEKYEAEFVFESNNLSGTYEVFVKIPRALSTRIGQITADRGQTIDASLSSLAWGDVVSDDIINIFDYNLLISHFGDRMPAEGSPADLDFDGDVDIFDYNLLVANFDQRGELPVEDDDNNAASQTILMGQRGWNLIGISVRPAGGLKASDLLNRTQGHCNEVDSFTNGFYTPLNSDTELVIGQGYFVRCQSPAQVVLRGTPLTDFPTLQPGAQLIAVPNRYKKNARGLLEDLNAKPGLNCQEVDRWVNGGWEGHLITLPPGVNNFSVTDQHGYLVKCR